MARIVILMKWFSAPLLLEKTRKACAALRALSVFIMALTLTTGCGSITGPDIEGGTRLKERDPKVAQMPSAEETVRGKDDPPIVTLQLGKALKQNTLRPAEQLPATVKIEKTNLNNVPVTVALEAVLADTDVTLLWESESLQDRTVTIMNLKGTLPQVVSRICRAAKIFCSYRNGALELTTEETFIVGLPPTASSSSGSSGTSSTISTAIESLIEGSVQTDDAGGNLIYTTNADGHERVQAYLDSLRNGRPLVVLQLHIWEVSLDSERQLGINWSQFQPAELGGKSQSLSTTIGNSLNSVAANRGISLGAVFSGAIDANVVARFLSTQGKVQNISSPQLTFVSGASAKFEVGGKRRFVSQVGTLVTSSVGGTTSTSGVSNNTVSTEELSTGLNITASGAYEGGVVFSTLQIETSDLVRIGTVQTGTTTLQLPETSDRKVETTLRVRPGDNLVLAGLQTSRDTRSRDGLLMPEGINGGTLPLYSQNDVTNSELVLLVKPSVVFFSDKEAPDLQAADAGAVLAPTAGETPAKTETPAVVAAETLPAPSAVADKPKDLPAPSPLQSEMATAVKKYEETIIAPVVTGVPTASANMADGPQNILPNMPPPSGQGAMP